MVGQQQQPLSTCFSQPLRVDHRNRCDAMLVAGQKPGPVNPTAQKLNKPVGPGRIILVGTICKIQHCCTLKKSGHRVKPISKNILCVSVLCNSAYQFMMSCQNQFQVRCLINTSTTVVRINHISPDRQGRNSRLRIMLHAFGQRPRPV